MDKILELRRKRTALVEEARAILDKAEAEKRDLNEVEGARYAAIITNIQKNKEAEARLVQLLGLEEEAKTAVVAAPHKPLPGSVAVLDPKGGFRSFGEFLRAVKYSPADTRLLALRTGGNEGVDTAGGFTVPTEFSKQILMMAVEASVMRPSGAMIIPMASDSIAIPRIVDTTHASSIFGGVVAYWTEEAGTVGGGGTDPAWGQVKLIAKKLTGYTYVSNELLADNAVGLEAVLMRMFAEALGYYEDTAFISGDGVGKPLGILKSGALLSVNRSAASTIAIADVANIYKRMLPSSMSRAVWFGNPGIMGQLIALGSTYLTWLNSSGGNGGMAAAPPATLLGRPIRFTEKCSALGTAGDLILVDPSYYLIGERQPIAIAASEHVRFTTDQTAWRFVERVDGQPWVDSAFTPANGSTLSPFVTLYSATTGGD